MPTATAAFTRPIRWLLAFTAGYFLLSFVVAGLRAGFNSEAMFWGLSGLSSAIIAQVPRRWRAALAAVVVASSGSCYLIFGSSIPLAIGFAVANGVQALVAATLLSQRLPQGRRIVRMRDIVWLVVAAAASSTVGAVFVAVSQALEGGAVDVATVGAWVMATTVGMLVGAPVVFAIISLRLEPPPETRLAPTLVIGATTALVLAGSMSASAVTGRNFSYLLIVPVMIAAVWLGQRHTALLVGGISIAIVFVTSRGFGPFADTESPFDPVLAAQLFLSVVQLTALTVGVESSRRRDVIAELDGILAATVEGVLVVDETGIIRHTNSGSETILGAESGDLIGEQLQAFVSFDDIPEEQALHLTRARRHDGSTFWAEVSRGEIYEKSGRRRTAVVVRDVTGRIETEESVRRIQDEFVSNMTHELKTPLTAIIGFSDWLLAEPDSGNVAGELETIRDSALSMQTLIDDILDFKRIAGSDGAREPVDLRSVVEQSIEVVSPAAVDRVIEISVELELNPTVIGDSDQLGHAVQNLLSNAVKYSSPGGRVEIELSQVGQSVVLTVTDHGIGIPEADVDRLFERFFRAGNTGNIHGTGLGLALVRQVVERHGGVIELSSALGEGTRVSVTLPLAVTKTAAAVDVGVMAGLAEDSQS